LKSFFPPLETNHLVSTISTVKILTFFSICCCLPSNPLQDQRKVSPSTATLKAIVSVSIGSPKALKPLYLVWNEKVIKHSPRFLRDSFVCNLVKAKRVLNFLKKLFHLRTIFKLSIHHKAITILFLPQLFNFYKKKIYYSFHQQVGRKIFHV